jgi:class 3 adenylate cyclase
VIVCSNCGQENPDVARFCLACGQPLAAAEASRDERRIVSVVFVDLVGFTARSEQLDPEDVRAFLAPYHDLVRRELESFGGVVEKFIGDAIVAVFGAPTAYGDDAERAVRAALAVRDSVRQLSELDVQVRIAVNTGEALVSLGARPELGEAMVAGDVVNTASRLQSAAPVGGVIVGRETYRTTSDAIGYESAPPVQAKGKSEPVEAWLALKPLHTAGERRHSGDLVGRARELDVLRGTWERVAGEAVPHLVTVLGPAGIGKTRLAQEFAAAVDEAGGRAVHGRSLPYRESSAYFAFSTQVKQLCGIFESDAPEVGLAKLRERIAAELPVAVDADTVSGHLAILLGLDPNRSVDDREELFFSVRCFIEGVAREQPTLLVFEDIHWADRGLLDLIELLAARLRDLPIMLLTLSRPELLDTRPSWGGGLPAYTALPLAPLSPKEAEQLAGLRLQTVGGDHAMRLAETAGGNPLFIEQLVATMAESTSATGSLPTTIRGLVAARLDALPAAERALLLDAAVVGKTFWRGALDQGGRADSTSELLGALERRDLIVRDTGSIIEGEQQFSFKHVLIRDVAYELLPRADRRGRHARVAEFFEASTAEMGEAAAALARHWREAGEPERALGFFIRAAEQAEHGWAKDQAALLYREGLDLVPDGDERLADLRRRVALARAATVHIPDARVLIHEASEAASRGSQPA